MKRSISFGMMLVGVLASGASAQASAQAAARPNSGTTATPRPQPPASEARRPAGTPVPAAPADLEEKIRPGHTALVVLDVLNDFCAEGGMMDAEGVDLTAVQAAARRIPRLLAAARAAAALVVFVRNEYTSAANSYLSDVWLEQAVRRRGASYTARDVCAAADV